MNDPLLEVSDLGRRVGGSWIWRGLDLTLEAGERAIVVGASGTGKTLFLRTLCGLDLPDEGYVRFRGAPVAGRDLPAIRARVLYLAQQPTLIPGTVRDNLTLPFAFGVHADRGFDEHRAARHFVDLGKPDDFLGQRSSVLSGGEGQLVALIRALLLEPAVLLLDEPTAHLDVDTTRAAERLILAWLSEGQRAVIWTSHDPAQVERIRRGPLLELGGDR